MFGGVGLDKRKIPESGTADEKVLEEDGIVAKEDRGEYQDALCSVLVQQNIARTKIEALTLLQGEALLKIINYKVSAAKSNDGI